jgi:trehalose 6-phosphate phosphatase
MTYVLSEEGRLALCALAANPTILYAFDFDGTLAPISPDRDTVTIANSMSEWLKELAKHVPCAVVSGRALADLAPRTGEAVPYLIGNHGI